MLQSKRLRERLTAFYFFYNPNKLIDPAFIPGLLASWQGTELTLFQSLTRKYGPEPTEKQVKALDKSNRAGERYELTAWVRRFYERKNRIRIDSDPGFLTRLLLTYRSHEPALVQQLLEKYGSLDKDGQIVYSYADGYVFEFARSLQNLTHSSNSEEDGVLIQIGDANTDNSSSTENAQQLKQEHVQQAKYEEEGFENRKVNDENENKELENRSNGGVDDGDGGTKIITSDDVSTLATATDKNMSPEKTKSMGKKNRKSPFAPFAKDLTIRNNNDESEEKCSFDPAARWYQSPSRDASASESDNDSVSSFSSQNSAFSWIYMTPPLSPSIQQMREKL
eukprot:g1364.t1